MECDLIYKGKQHGFKAHDFHNFTDSKYNILVIVHNDKDELIGGKCLIIYKKRLLNLIGMDREFIKEIIKL